MPTRSFQVHFDTSIADQSQAVRFLNRVSWTMVVVLACIAIALGVTPSMRAAGHERFARVMAFLFLLCFLGLIALLVVVRRRLAKQIEGSAKHLEMLAKQNGRLVAQTEELELQAEALQEQTVELEEQATELQEHAAGLELLTRRLNVAQQVAGLGYWEIDGDTGEVFWSDEMYRFCGIEPGSAPPRTELLLNCLHPEDRERMRLAAKNATKNLTEFRDEYRLTTPGTKQRIIQVGGYILVDPHGKRRLVGTVQDITARTQLETQLRHSQKMEAIGRLAGGVAHDFNNILTVIEAYTGFLLAGETMTGEPRASVEQIRDSARSAAALTRQLLAFSRQQVLQPRVLDINESVRGIERMLGRLVGEHIEIRAVYGADLPPVKADPGQVEQVLMNLAINARDAMPNGGRLTVETGIAELDAAYAQRHPVKHLGPHVMLAVSDTGTGISPEDLDRIFEPFFTTKELGKGTGLGLSMVHGIVEQSGGHIWVYSEMGHGTTFKVYLPSTNETLDESVNARPMIKADGSETILLVEDNAPLRRVACLALRRFGYTVIEARNGAEALATIENSAQGIDLLITDMVMPGMGGADLVARARELRPTLPTLLMSGYTEDAVGEGGEQKITGAFIEKPFTGDALARKAREVLDTSART